jgi:ribonuclease HI
MSSTRTEVCGIFAALTHLRLIVELFHIVLREKASCRIYCDSRAALARVDDKYYEDFGTMWRCRQHYDFEVAIRTCLLQLPISIEWEWVRGHACSRKKEQDFTVPEVLKEVADDLATLARQRPICTPQDNDHWPEQTVSIIGPRGRICDRLASELRYCCTAGDLCSYWCSRFHWSSSQVALLDLIGTQKALSKFSPDAKRRIQKLRCGWLPVSIGEYLAKILIDRTAANLARPGTWSKKRSNTFNARINFLAMQCTIVLQACPRLFGRRTRPI